MGYIDAFDQLLDRHRVNDDILASDWQLDIIRIEKYSTRFYRCQILRERGRVHGNHDLLVVPAGQETLLC